jgi:predicted transcriptional regulator of viral defense system
MRPNFKIKDWVNDLQKKGKLFFSLDEASIANPDLLPTGVNSALKRLSSKGSITSVWKGYYVIVPISYSMNGILPPIMYIDSLMQALQRKYYIGLLNAAAFYGAAHQQPQAFSVFIQRPTLRDSRKKKINLQFICRNKIPSEDLLQKHKTQTGYVTISNAILTAADIIQYEKEIGGLNRACTVLNDMVEMLDFTNLPSTFFEFVSVSTIQRLGYLLEQVIEQQDLANVLFEKAQEAGCNFQPIALKNRKSTENCIQDKKWKVIVNTEIEIDD